MIIQKCITIHAVVVLTFHITAVRPYYFQLRFGVFNSTRYRTY